MYYFVGIDLPPIITGVDRAMFNRIHLFKLLNLPAKILYFNYYPTLYANAEKFGVENDILSLYDSFYEIPPSFKRETKDWMTFFQDYKHYIPVQVNQSNDYMLYHNKQLVAYARFSDNTLTTIEHISYYDKQLKKVREDQYDSRGFKSGTTYFNDDERPVVQHIFSIHGKIKIQRYFDTSSEKNTIKHIILNDSVDEEIIFQSENEFLAYCFEKLYQSGDLFIIDRPLEMVPVFNLVRRDIPATVVMHAAPLNDMYLPHQEVMYQYKSLIQQIERFNAIIVSTEAQKNDLENITNNKTKVFAIPVGFIENQQIKVNSNKRKSNQIISIARYENGKQHEHQFRLIKKLISDFPDIELHLYGYGTKEQTFRELIQALQLENHIFIHPFERNIDTIYQNAILTLSTSYSEGFALNILESLTNHTPVIAYDVKYGPSEMIINYVNGNLIERNNEDSLYENVKNFLLNPEIQSQYINNCEESIQKFNKDNIAAKWLQFTQSDIY